MSDVTTNTDSAANRPAGLLVAADRVLQLLRDRAPDAEGEVTVRRGTEALTRFANSFIHQNVAEETSRVSLRVALDGRVAAARITGSGDAALARLVEDVLESARTGQVDPDWPGVSGPQKVPDIDHWDQSTADATPDERAARVRAFVDAAGGLETAGACDTNAAHVAFASTGGHRVTGRATTASIDGIARTGTSDGSGRLASARLADVDGAEAGRRAGGKARAAADPTDLEPGRYEVVLEPQAVADVLGFLFLYGFNARAVEEGQSFVRLNEAQFDPAISLRDDASDPGQVGLSFDAEGVPKRRVDVVRAGVTSAIVHTRRTAAKAGTASTGHAHEESDQYGAVATNIVLDPGPRPASELLASVRRGLLVTDFWYTRVLDPRTLVVTGLTRNGVWLLEDGRIVRPVRNLRFTQSYVDALGPGAVAAISADRALVFDDEVALLVPTLRLASWNFTGGAKG